MKKDVLTLQFGAFSNSIGAHFWNAQDELFSTPFGFEAKGGLEVDPDILYVHGEDSATGRATYTPRLLVFDIAGSDGLSRAVQGGSFGANGLRRRAAFGDGGKISRKQKKESNGGASSIANLVDSYARSQMPRNKFLEFLEDEDGGNDNDDEQHRDRNDIVNVRSGNGNNNDNDYNTADFGDIGESVRCWGDYLKPRLHPSSLVGVGGRSSTGESLGPASSALTGGTAKFDAFTDGAFLMCEALEDRSRKFLEASDFLSGIVSTVDLDSGFGSFAVEYLYYLRDQCPHTPMLVLGALAPPSVSLSPVQQSLAVTAGSFDYSGKDRDTLRDINVGLAFASFASSSSAKDLDATFIPLINPMYDSAVTTASSFSPGRIAFEASAPLSIAWDSITLPFRRSSSYADGVFPLAEMENEGENDGAVRRDGHIDARQRTRGGGDGGGESENGGRDWKRELDASIEFSGEAPLASISSSISMGGFLSLITPAPYLRLATVSLSFPFAYPRSSASSLQHALNSAAPLHAHSASFAMPLSWTSSKVPSTWRKVTDKDSIRQFASRPSPPGSDNNDEDRHNLLDEEGLPEDFFPAPLAHAIIMRGVGAHAISQRGGGGGGDERGSRYTSSVEAYGRVLDTFMSRTRCRAAGHSIFRTPVAVPLTLPTSLFPEGVYDAAGAYSSSSSSSTMGVSAPFSSPALLHVACTTAYTPNLQSVLQRFKRGARDRHSSVLHRYERGFDSMRRGGGSSLGFEETENALASLFDDYSK